MSGGTSYSPDWCCNPGQLASSETSGDSLVSSRWWNSSGPPGLPGRSSGRSGIFGELPAKHRASGCALEALRMAIALSDELQESVGPGANRAVRAVCGRSVSGR